MHMVDEIFFWKFGRKSVRPCVQLPAKGFFHSKSLLLMSIELQKMFSLQGELFLCHEASFVSGAWDIFVKTFFCSNPCSNILQAKEWCQFAARRKCNIQRRH